MYLNHFTLVAGPNGAGKSTLKDEFIRPGTD
jgi:ABC-type Mn2+/Zn2+ transport system ATPase subunit